MDDRQLLEAAAKAAGLWDYAENCIDIPWSPLINDGDALRLAVRMGMFFRPEFAHFLSLERFSAQERDDCHATRRAIVRAAAALGERE